MTGVKVTDFQIELVKEKLEEDKTYAQIAKEVGLARCTVTKIANGGDYMAEKKVNEKTYSKMREFALQKGYKTLSDALAIPGRYEFIQEFKKTKK